MSLTPSLPDPHLEELLSRALIPSYTRATWFRGCTLEKSRLLVPDPQLAASIRRHFLAQIRRTLPDCQVVVDRSPRRSVSTVYTGQAVQPRQRFLDEE